MIQKYSIRNKKSGFNLSFIDILFISSLFLLPILFLTYDFLLKYHNALLYYNSLAQQYEYEEYGVVYWFNINVVKEFDKVLFVTIYSILFVLFLLFISLFFKIKTKVKYKRINVSFSSILIFVLFLLIPLFFLMYHNIVNLNIIVWNVNNLIYTINANEDLELTSYTITYFLFELPIKGYALIDYFLYPSIILSFLTLILIYGKMKGGLK